MFYLSYRALQLMQMSLADTDLQADAVTLRPNSVNTAAKRRNKAFNPMNTAIRNSK